MKTKIKFALFSAVYIGIVATVAYAAATGDRLKIPVMIGQGQSVIEKLIFDIGSGSTNPVVQSTSGGTVQLSNNGTNFMSVQTASDTIVGRATSDTLTNKVLTDNSNSFRLATTSVTGAVSTTTQTFGGSKTIAESDATGVGPGLTLSNTNTSGTLVITGGSSDTYPRINSTLSGQAMDFYTNGVLHMEIGATGNLILDGSHATGAGTQVTASNTNTGQGIFMDSGTGDSSPYVGTSVADDLILRTNGSEVLRAKNGGGVNITGTGGNTPHICVTRTATRTNTNESIACNAGEIVTGGGCSGDGVATITQSNPSGQTWSCAYNSSIGITAYAICCQY